MKQILTTVIDIGMLNTCMKPLWGLMQTWVQWGATTEVRLANVYEPGMGLGWKRVDAAAVG